MYIHWNHRVLDDTGFGVLFCCLVYPFVLFSGQLVFFFLSLRLFFVFSCLSMLGGFSCCVARRCCCLRCSFVSVACAFVSMFRVVVILFLPRPAFFVCECELCCCFSVLVSCFFSSPCSSFPSRPFCLSLLSPLHPVPSSFPVCFCACKAGGGVM